MNFGQSNIVSCFRMNCFIQINDESNEFLASNKKGNDCFVGPLVKQKLMFCIIGFLQFKQKRKIFLLTQHKILHHESDDDELGIFSRILFGPDLSRCFKLNGLKKCLNIL